MGDLTSLPTQEFIVEAHRLFRDSDPSLDQELTTRRQLEVEGLPPARLVMDLAASGDPRAARRLRGYQVRRALMRLDRIRGLGRALAILRVLVRLPELARQVRLNEFVSDRMTRDKFLLAAALGAQSSRVSGSGPISAHAGSASTHSSNSDLLRKFVEERLSDYWALMLQEATQSRARRTFEPSQSLLADAGRRRPGETVLSPARFRLPETPSVGVSSGAEPTNYARRSWVDRRRLTLLRAFGAEAVTETFLEKVSAASRAVERSGTAVSPIIHDVVIARWLLSGRACPTALDSLSEQLRALYYAAFTCSGVNRTAAEMDVCNGVAAQASATSVFPTVFRDLPITAFMLAALAEDDAVTPNWADARERQDACTHFFLSFVPAHDLERHVTPSQRRAVRQHLKEMEKGASSLIANATVGGGQDSIDGHPSPSPEDVERDASKRLWSLGLDYLLSEDELERGQVSVDLTEAGWKVHIPQWILARVSPPRASDADSAKAWLSEIVSDRRYELNLPRRLFSSSVFAFLKGDLTQGKPRAGDAQVSGLAGDTVRRRLRPGAVITFCNGGAGAAYQIGRNWGLTEPTHTWTTASTALLALHLMPEDAGPLELFLDFIAGPDPDTQVSISWNGQTTAMIQTSKVNTTSLVCSLGSRHRTGRSPNILCLSTDRLFSPRQHGQTHDDRLLGLGLRRLALVRR